MNLEVAKEESDQELLWEDQQNINKFSKLSNKILEKNAELKVTLQEKEYLEDILQELELADEEEEIKYKVGGCFVSLSLEQVQQRLQDSLKEGEKKFELLTKEIKGIDDEMSKLKVLLYGKFGKLRRFHQFGIMGKTKDQLICPTWFTRRHDLERHFRTHTGDKPFKCPRQNLNCFASFSRKDLVLRHMRSIHKEDLVNSNAMLNNNKDDFVLFSENNDDCLNISLLNENSLIDENFFNLSSNILNTSVSNDNSFDGQIDNIFTNFSTNSNLNENLNFNFIQNDSFVNHGNSYSKFLHNAPGKAQANSAVDNSIIPEQDYKNLLSQLQQNHFSIPLDNNKHTKIPESNEKLRSSKAVDVVQVEKVSEIETVKKAITEEDNAGNGAKKENLNLVNFTLENLNNVKNLESVITNPLPPHLWKERFSEILKNEKISKNLSNLWRERYSNILNNADNVENNLENKKHLITNLKKNLGKLDNSLNNGLLIDLVLGNEETLPSGKSTRCFN
ncbi:hypothetical protein HK099_005392 [Clydaea vesicula]|uniref:C2H2-type domain-containing protein n=1 Tax=Clydaea vesicula TaxID=447962 RepID=A0AAD5XYZ5_9FUNG|nr:hypothetical protein HK099_005392 [Clydaea vesicula]